MKIRSYLFAGVVLLLCQDLHAQIVQPARTRDFACRKPVDSVSVEVAYSCRIRRILEPESYSSDLQILEIGEKYSRYFSSYAEQADSLYTNFRKYANFGKDRNGYFREGTYEDIFINYPESGQISVVNRYVSKNFIYEEKRPELKWEILSDTENILGYECFKASAHFRGRTWYAWFTMDIPLNYGPWKLSGLPGLILKAEDSDRYFTYEAVGIRQNLSKPMMMYNEAAQKCKRSEILVFNDLRWKDGNFLLKMMSGQEVLVAYPDNIKNSIRNDIPQEKVIPQRELE